MNPAMNWTEQATLSANRIKDELFSAHRGAIPWRDVGVSVVFGNDGYGTSDRAKREVEHVRQQLASLGMKELGFGTDAEDGYTWAMLVLSGDHEELHRLVWCAWDAACGKPPGYSSGQTQAIIAAIETINWDNPPGASLN